MITEFKFKYTKAECTGHYYYELHRPYRFQSYVPKGVCVMCGHVLAGNDYRNLTHMIDTFPELGKMSPEISKEYLRFSDFRCWAYKQIQINMEYTYDI